MGRDECEECRIWQERGVSFCGACGRNLKDRSLQSEGISDDLIYYVFAGISIICSMTILCLSLVFIFTNFNDVLNGLTTLGRALFITGLTAVILSLAFALYTTYRSKMKNGDRFGNILSSGTAGFGIGLAVVLGLSYVYIFATLALQQDISTEIFNKYTKYQLSAMLMLAGPEEEFLYRLLPIGIPMMLIGYITRRRNSWKYILGGFGTPKVAWALIVISAVIFGFAHLDSWNLVKVPQAAISGIIFGYLYCEYGIYVSILAHSTLDCITVAGYIIGNTGSSLISMLLMLCGIVLILIIVIKVNREGLKHEEWIGEEPPPGIRTIWNRH